MDNVIYRIPEPENEPVYSYAPRTQERGLLMAALADQERSRIEVPLIINGKEVRTGRTKKAVMPHCHAHVLAEYHIGGGEEIQAAIDAALKAKMDWMNMPWIERASILMKAAELVSKKYRQHLNAATMLGQSKNACQAEIDSACETADFLRFNPYFASRIYTEQPKSRIGYLDRLEYRPLEGFVAAITPFNFTAIAANLTTSVAVMGNTVLWKPASTSIPSNYLLMKVLQEAGLPDGVINFVPCRGEEFSRVILHHKDLAGIHFTGSTGVFNDLWRGVGQNLHEYRSYPKLIGETGGKNFIFVHASADPSEVITAIIRGAFEYQGQKCSAASRAYIPKSLWNAIKPRLLEEVSTIRMGDVKDFTCFMNAVIDEASYDNIMGYLEFARNAPDAGILAGGMGDKTTGYFIEPTVILTDNPHFKTMEEEIFGPVITIHVYNDDRYEETLRICDGTSVYSLTGAVFARDRYAASMASKMLRYSAGNFYINDKPTGAVVAEQPFGGSRSSGTNDKAGSRLNLLRWVNPRTIKETFRPPIDYRYPFMERD